MMQLTKVHTASKQIANKMLHTAALSYCSSNNCESVVKSLLTTTTGSILVEQPDTFSNVSPAVGSTTTVMQTPSASFTHGFRFGTAVRALDLALPFLLPQAHHL